METYPDLRANFSRLMCGPGGGGGVADWTQRQSDTGAI